VADKQTEPAKTLEFTTAATEGPTTVVLAIGIPVKPVDCLPVFVENNQNVDVVAGMFAQVIRQLDEFRSRPGEIKLVGNKIEIPTASTPFTFTENADPNTRKALQVGDTVTLVRSELQVTLKYVS